VGIPLPVRIAFMNTLSMAAALENTGEGDNTLVTVVLTGLPAGGPYPWHVHEGTCETGGPIVGDPAVYPPLTVGTDGRAEANTRLINLRLSEARKYHVNVHRSPSDLATIIACGELDD
jgi:hypothetical protein